MVGLDVIRGGQSSGVAQYLFPCYLGIELSVAYLLATKITVSDRPNSSRGGEERMTSYSVRRRRIKLWQIVIAVLISGGVVSSAVNTKAETWWRWSEFDVEAAKIINQSSQPLVISDARFGAIAPLSYRLDSKVKMLLVSNPNLNIPNGFSEIFLYNSSPWLLAEIEQKPNVSTQLVYQFQEDSLIVSLFRIREKQR